VEQEIFRRITADAELGKNNQLGAELAPGATRILNYFPGIAGNITDRKINLSQRNFDSVVHGQLQRFCALTADDFLHLRSKLRW
jgi:hypothetical protein